MEKEKKSPNSTRNILIRVAKFWLPVASWAIVIFLFSARPTNPVSRIYWKDFIIKKSAHVVEYAVFTALLYRALKESGIEKREALLFLFIAFK